MVKICRLWPADALQPAGCTTTGMTCCSSSKAGKRSSLSGRWFSAGTLDLQAGQHCFYHAAFTSHHSPKADVCIILLMVCFFSCTCTSGSLQMDN